MNGIKNIVATFLITMMLFIVVFCGILVRTGTGVTVSVDGNSIVFSVNGNTFVFKIFDINVNTAPNSGDDEGYVLGKIPFFGRDSDSKVLEESNAPERFQKQPQNCRVNAGDELYFGVEAVDPSRYKYEWQYCEHLDENKDYSKLVWKRSQAKTANSNELIYTAKTEYSGRAYRCVLTDLVTHEIVTSDAVWLMVI